MYGANKQGPISRLENEVKRPKNELNFSKHKAADFEEAILATGFGKFNILLLFLQIPSSFTQAFENMGLSYVVPIAQCDLNLSLEQKGLLSAVPFIGMISSGLVFGIICDFIGRRKLIVYGFFFHSLCSMVTALSPNFMALMIAKFVCGFIFNGPFVAATTLLSECHASKYRSKVQLIRGISYSLGFVFLPIIAWGILPLKINFLLFGYLEFHSWNLYLLLCSFGPLISALGFYFIPESPKFLMSNGKNEEALLVFQKVYGWNSGNSNTDYPIKQLNEEVTNISKGKHASLISEISKFLYNMKPLFRYPYLFRLILACTTAFTLLLGLSTLKLWLPQILQLTNDYKQNNNGSSFSVCSMINTLSKTNSEPGESCQVNIDPSVYLRAAVILGPQVLIFAGSGFIVNFLGKKRLIAILASTASVCAIGLYFAPNSNLMITLFAIYIPFLDLSGVMIVTISLEMFATHFRTSALSFHFMAARLGATTANVLFAHLVGIGCITPFLFCTIIAAALPFLMILYPNTENKHLE